MARLGYWMAALICLGLGWAGSRTWRADQAYEHARGLVESSRGDGLEALRQAVAMRPDWAEPRQLLARQLSLFDPRDALEEARRALRLDPHSWDTWDEVATLEYQLGNPSAAWQAIQDGLEVNRSFLAHYQAANLGLILGRPQIFWSQIQQAIATSPAEQFQVALGAAVEESQENVAPLVKVLPYNNSVRLSQAVEYLITRGYTEAAAKGWENVHTCPDFAHTVCGHAAARVADALLRSTPPGAASLANGPRAIAVWNRAVEQGWLPHQAVVTLGHNLDPNFLHPWFGLGFSWQSQTPVLYELQAGARPGDGNTATFLLDGSEPERASLLRQRVAVEPDSDYEVVCRAQRSAPGVQEGVEAVLTNGNQTLLRAPLTLHTAWTDTHAVFHTGPGDWWVDLTVVYQRQPGNALMRTPVSLALLELRPAPPPSRRAQP